MAFLTTTLAGLGRVVQTKILFGGGMVWCLSGMEFDNWICLLFGGLFIFIIIIIGSINYINSSADFFFFFFSFPSFSSSTWSFFPLFVLIECNLFERNCWLTGSQRASKCGCSCLVTDRRTDDRKSGHHKAASTFHNFEYLYQQHRSLDGRKDGSID